MVQNIQKMITIRNLENEKKMIDNNIEFEDPQEEEIIQLVNRTVYLRSIQWVPFTVFIVSFFLTLVFVNIYTGGVPSAIGSPTGPQTKVTIANEQSNNLGTPPLSPSQIKTDPIAVTPINTTGTSTVIVTPKPDPNKNPNTPGGAIDPSP